MTDISLPQILFQLFLAMCVVVTRKNLYTHYSQVTSMPKNERSAEGGREGAGRNTVRRGGAAGVRPSKVGKLMGSNGETDKCTAGKTNNPIKKENPLALPRHPARRPAGFRIPNSPGSGRPAVHEWNPRWRSEESSSSSSSRSSPSSSLLYSLMISKRDRYSSIFE